MAWRFVKQPNGLLARFSEVVDDFTHAHLSEEEAIALCREEYGMAEDESRQKVQRGVNDEPIDPDSPNGPPDGLRRYREALEDIRIIHGPARHDQAVQLIEGEGKHGPTV